MQIKKPLPIALAVWGSLTLLVLFVILFIGLRWGRQAWKLFVQGAFHTPANNPSISRDFLVVGRLIHLFAGGPKNQLPGMLFPG